MTEHHHASPLFIAKLLTNRLAPDEAAGPIVAHLLATCPECRAAWAEVERLKSAAGHWDELVAVTESAAAPELLAQLDPWTSPTSRRRRPTASACAGSRG